MNTTLQYDGGLQTVMPLQVVYLDFDGEVSSYNGEVLTIDEVVVEDSGLSAAEIATLIERLNEAYLGSVLFVAERPEAGDCSTVFVGHTDAFPYRGLAETVDHGNQNRNDNAFVNLRGDESLEQIQQTISHEVDHLMGTLDHGGEGVGKYTAQYDVSSGVTSTGVVLNTYNDSMYISNGGAASNTTVNAGNMFISNGGVAANTTVNAGGGVIIKLGGVANSTTVNSGSMTISSGGVANNATVNSWGRIYVSSGGSALNIDWTPCVGQVDAANGAYVTYTSTYSGCYFGSNNTLLSSAMIISGKTVAGSMYIFFDGIANNTAVNSGRLYVSSGGIAISTTVNTYGHMYISSGGVANNIAVNFGGYMFIASGGSAFDVDWTPCVGSIYAEDGAYVTYTSAYTGCYFGSNNTLLSSALTMSEKNVSGYYGSMYIFSGGVANNTTLSDGYMCIFSGGVANNTTLSDGYMCISSGGVASNTAVNSRGYMYIASGGTAGNTTVNADGYMNISSGGVANNTKLEGVHGYQYESELGFSYEYLYIASMTIGHGGLVNSTTVNSYSDMYISSGGVANFTTVNDLGNMYVSNGGAANNTMVNSSGAMHILSGGTATIIFNPWQGSVTSFAGAVVAYLDRDANCYYKGHGIASKADIFNDLTINDALIIYSGGVANHTSVTSSGIISISSGGTANSTTVNSYGVATVAFAGEANNTTINGGYVTIHSGGIVNNTTVNAGSMFIASGGSALNVDWTPCEGKVNAADGAYVTYTSAYSGCYFGSNNTLLSSAMTMSGKDVDGAMCIFSGGVTNNTTVNHPGYMCILNGGVANNTTVNPDGSIYVSSGGEANSTVLNCGFMSIYLGGVANNTTVSNIGALNVFSGGVANNTMLSDGYMYISSGGVANNTAANFEGHIYISSGGMANSTTINSNGSAIILSGGVASHTTVNSGGQLFVADGGNAYFTTYNHAIFDDSVILRSGDVANSTTVNYGAMTISSGGMATGTTVNYAMYISCGGMASNTTVNGALTISSGGMASNTTVNGGDMDISDGGVANNTTMRSWSYMTISSGGIANYVVMHSRAFVGGDYGAFYHLGEGSAFIETLFDGNNITGNASGLVLSGRLHVQSGGVTQDTIILDGSINIQSGGVTQDTTILNGSMFICNGGVANNAALTGSRSYYEDSYGDGKYRYHIADMTVSSGGVANNTAVNSHGSMTVASGGVASHTIVNSGGQLFVADGGNAYFTTYNHVLFDYSVSLQSGDVANNTTVNSNGSMTILSGGVANNTMMSSGGTIHISSGGSALNVDWTPCEGKINAEDGAYVTYASSYSGCYLGVNNTLLSSAMIMSGKNVNGEMYVFSGGTADNTTLKGSYDYEYGYCIAGMTVFNGGMASNTTVNSHGNMYISSGGVANNTMLTGNYDYDCGYNYSIAGMTVFNGGVANNTTLTGSNDYDYSYGIASMVVSSGGTVNSTIVNSYGSMTIVSGGVANDTMVNGGGTIHISSGGTATIVFNPWQGNVVSSTGAQVTYLEREANCYYIDNGEVNKADTVNNLIINNNIIIYSGGVANDTTLQGSRYCDPYYGNYYDRVANMVVNSGGIVGNTTVNGYGNMYVSSGGVANNTMLTGSYEYDYENGEYHCVMAGMTVSDGGIANSTTINSNGSATILSGGVASHTTVNSGGQLFVADGGNAYFTTYNHVLFDYSVSLQSGDVANSTTVNSNGSMTILSGGVANSTTVNSDGMIFVSDGGRTSGATVNSKGKIYLSSGATADATTLYQKGSMYISNGAQAKNTILSGGGILGYSGGLLDDSIMYAGYFYLSGGTAANTTVHAGMMEVDSGAAAAQTTLYGGSMAVYSGGMANSTTVNSYASMTISSGGTANNTTVNSNGYMTISSGGIASNGAVNSYGHIDVSSGGTANNTTVNSSGCMYIASGGTANDITMHSGAFIGSDDYSGFYHLGKDSAFIETLFDGNNITGSASGLFLSGTLNVQSGGILHNAAVNAGGFVNVFHGGIVSNAMLQCSGYPYAYMTIFADGVANDTIVNSWGEMQLSSGGVTNNTTVNSNGGVTIFSAGAANNTTVNSRGWMYISSGGVANSATVNMYGSIHIGGTANSITVNSGGLAEIFTDGAASSTIVNSGGHVDIFGVASDTIVNLGGYIGIIFGGVAESTTVNSSGSMTISNGGVASHTTLNSGGYIAGFRNTGANAVLIEEMADDLVVGTMNNLSFSGRLDLGNGGVADNTIVNANAHMFISNGGTASRTTVNTNGSMSIFSGGVATSNTVRAHGSMLISSGGTANHTTLNSDGFMHIRTGGVANSTAVNSGGSMLIFSGGVANNVTQASGGNIGVVVYGNDNATKVTGTNQNGSFSLSNGVASNFLIGSSGFMGIAFGGMANHTTVTSGGSLSIDSGGSASGIVASKGAQLEFHVARNTYIQGTSNGSAFEMKNAFLSGYTATGGSVGIEYGGVASNTTLNNGHLFIASSGCAGNTTMNAGRMVINRGTAHNTTITSAAQVENSGGKMSGELNITGGAEVYVSAGGVIDFTVTGRSVSDGYLVNDLSRITGAPTFTITVTNTQAAGNYKLAQNALSVSRSITIGNGSFDYGTLACNGASVKYGDNEYSLLLHETGNLTLEVKRAGGVPDIEAPTITGIAASTTAPTNQNVMVTAVFADNIALASKQYRLGTGNWLDYTGAVTVTANTTVYFKAVDTAGNEANVQYAVSNIDKVAPTITGIAASATAATNRDVTVTANFADNVAVASKQYRIGNGSWQNYTNGVTMTANGSVYFKAVDTAGNEVSGQYAVSNIDKIAPTITQIKASATAPTNQNVTVTATFADNVALATKQYRIGTGAWQNYANGVIMSANGTVYFKAVDTAGNEVAAQYVVSNIDKVAPTITQIKASATAPTNQNVTVTATFADNVALKSQQYKIGDGGWQNYTNGVTMNANGTVFFKAVDTAGNETTGQYTVSNIDKIAPTAPTLSVNTVYRTNGTVTVTANFAANVVKKEYSLDGKSWLSYTKAVAVSANTTIQVRGYDEAGNASGAEYKITNIVPLDARGPGAVVLTPKVSKYNVTVKWSKPATQDKAKIAGYEVEYNGKISIVKGASLSLKNVAVSTGNTVQVRAIDSLGRYGALSQVVSFDVKDVTAPKLGKVTAAINGYTGTVSWSGSDNVGIVKYVVTCAGKSQTVTGTSAKFTDLDVGKYNATVQAFDAAGNASKIGKASITVKDATPPEKVTGLVIPLADAKYNALLSWSPGKDNSNKISGYEIKLDNGRILKSSKTSLKVSKLSVGTHTYQVRAIDPTKNVGAWSDVQTFTVKDMTAPATVLIKAKVEGNLLSLTWSTPKDNVGVTGYILKHGVNLEKTETLKASQLSFQIKNIAKGNYQYQIVAVDAAGNQSKAKSGKATIKTELPMTAMSLELPDAIPSLAFDAGASTNSTSAGLCYDDPLAICSVLQTENELRLTASDLFASDNEKKSSSLLAVGL